MLAKTKGKALPGSGRRSFPVPNFSGDPNGGNDFKA